MYDKPLIMRLLLVEDDETLGDGLQVGLTQEGYCVEWVKDGHLANIALRDNSFDLLVLDLGLPKMNGMNVLRELRKRKDNVPVLILTAYDASEHRVNGLDAGADDYLVKPFDLDELFARLRALQRRLTGRTHNLIEHGDLRLDPSSHQVRLRDHNIDLSHTEYRLLLYLLNNTGKVASRQKLEELIHGWDGGTESNSLEVFIHHIRKKLGSDLIRTIRGVGYIIEKSSC